MTDFDRLLHRLPDLRMMNVGVVKAVKASCL
jgi:hypothetical protein